MTVTVLAILQHENEKGKYPDSLEELITAGYLKKIPLDPYSDETLVYRRTDDGFILYSVGHNFKDNGGEFGKDKKGKTRLWGAEGDVVFWPVGRN